MSDHSTRLWGPAPQAQAAPGEWPKPLAPLLITLLAATLAGLLWTEWPTFQTLSHSGVPVWLLLGMSFLLAFIPLCICVVQNVTRSRQLRRLESLDGAPVSETCYFKAAKAAVDQVRTVSVNSDYTVAMIVYGIVLLIGFCAIALALALPDVFKTPNVLLGGWQAGTLSATLNAPAFTDYQAQTFVIASAAFLGSYVYAISRLLDRVNNNDLYPISLYYYTVRVLVALFVAIVIRHAAGAFSLENGVLILVAFGVGIAPDLFLISIIRRAFQVIKIWGVRSDPDSDTHPTSLPLLMVDDLSRDKIDRLNELGIDNAQVLANQNPFLLWPRLPYDLTLIVDWIGQAHLYALVRDASLAALRKIFVRDSFDLEIRLTDQASRAGVCQALALDPAAADVLIAQLRADPAYARLKQVREALATISVRPGE